MSTRALYQQYLLSKGLSPTQVGGILLNIEDESGFNPSAQGAAGEYGLFQHLGARKQNLFKYAGTSTPNWQQQIDYALTESDMQDYLKKDYPNYGEAGVSFLHGFERPAAEHARARAAKYRSQHSSDIAPDSYTIPSNAIAPGPAYQDQGIQFTGGQAMPQGLLSQGSGGFGLFEPTMGQQLAANPLLLAGLGIMATDNIGQGALLGLKQANQAQSAQQRFQLELTKTLGRDGPDLTALERQLQAVGLQPGTPAYQQAMWRLLTQPKTSVTTNVDTGNVTEEYIPPGALGPAINGDPSRGYPFPDQNDPTGVKIVKPTGATQTTEGESKAVASRQGALQSIAAIRAARTRGSSFGGVPGIFSDYMDKPNFGSAVVATAAKRFKEFGIDFTPSEDTTGMMINAAKLRTLVGQMISGADVPESQMREFEKFMPTPGERDEVTDKKIELLEQMILNYDQTNFQLRQQEAVPFTSSESDSSSIDTSDEARLERLKRYLPGLF